MPLKYYVAYLPHVQPRLYPAPQLDRVPACEALEHINHGARRVAQRKAKDGLPAQSNVRHLRGSVEHGVGWFSAVY